MKVLYLQFQKFVVILFGFFSLPQKVITANGHLFGYPIRTTVDSELAKSMLANPTEISVTELFAKYASYELNTKTLSVISERYSLDVSTLYFLQRAYQSELNKRYQDKYLSLLYKQIAGESIQLEVIQKFHVVFIPGFAYKEDPSTGADFAKQISLLNVHGISHELVETGEWDLVDDNAKLVAEKLIAVCEKHEKIIVVSASKGGLETSIALGKILKSDDSKSIKSWISVGGILRGSPLADNYSKAHYRWYVKFRLWLQGKSFDIVHDLSYVRRSEEYNTLAFPKELKIIHLVGAPLATQISKDIKQRYNSIKLFGPNDGLTPIADEITKDGIVVSELGLDHYYRNEHIDKMTLSLAILATEDI